MRSHCSLLMHVHVPRPRRNSALPTPYFRLLFLLPFLPSFLPSFLPCFVPVYLLDLHVHVLLRLLGASLSAILSSDFPDVFIFRRGVYFRYIHVCLCVLFLSPCLPLRVLVCLLGFNYFIPSVSCCFNWIFRVYCAVSLILFLFGCTDCVSLPQSACLNPI